MKTRPERMGIAMDVYPSCLIVAVIRLHSPVASIKVSLGDPFKTAQAVPSGFFEKA